MTYWERRKRLKYYQHVEKMITLHSPADSILDVGCADTPIATIGDFDKRFTVDLYTDPELDGVESYVADFTTWEPPQETFSVVTCLQTIEHLQDEEIRPFVDKLHAISRVLIVSLPWRWRRSLTKTHYQDPIDWNKLISIMGDVPQSFELITDNGLTRIVTIYS